MNSQDFFASCSERHPTMVRACAFGSLMGGVASLHLRSRGFEEFSPSYKVERQWSDRKRSMDQSLLFTWCVFLPPERLS